MSRKKPLESARFPVGHKIEGGGAKPGVVAVLKEAGFTREMIECKVADILLMTKPETQAMKNDASTSNFDHIIIAVVEAAQRNADCARMDNLLEKIFGKTINIKGTVSVQNTGNTPANITYGDAELVQRAIERALINSANA